jgi:hypothetical protein
MLVSSSLLAGEIDFMSPLRSLGWVPGRRIMSIHTQRRFRGERSVENGKVGLHGLVDANRHSLAWEYLVEILRQKRYATPEL